MLLGGHSASINFLIIIQFITILNFSTNSLPVYSLPLATLLNSYTNFSIVPLPCSTFFNSATFIVLLSFPLNYLFKSAKNSPTVIYSNVLAFKSSKKFSFQVSADPPCIYDNTN